jgi:hypothetical protein
MSGQTAIEQRVAVLEGAVAELQRRLAAVSAPANWLDRVTGSVTDEAAFLEALELGRAWRDADRPADNSSGRP